MSPEDESQEEVPETIESIEEKLKELEEKQKKIDAENNAVTVRMMAWFEKKEDLRVGELVFDEKVKQITLELEEKENNLDIREARIQDLEGKYPEGKEPSREPNGLLVKDAVNSDTNDKNIIYRGRLVHRGGLSVGVSMDVKSLITPFDSRIDELFSNDSFFGDGLADSIFDQVTAKIKKQEEAGDVNGVSYWQFPFETIATRSGKEEDIAVLLASSLMYFGINSYRVRVTMSDVLGGSKPCIYVSYLRDSDCRWVALDPSDDNKLKVSEMTSIPLNKRYRKKHMTFNNEVSWAKLDLDFVKFSDIS